MSWITIVWSMNAAACLTLAGIALLVWCKQRENWVHLVFSASAVAAAAIAAFELAMMHCETVWQYEALVRWIHVPTWVLIVSFVSFVRLYLHAGRPWLAWTICGLRTVVLILNFIFTPNLNFRQITGLHHFSWGGEIISVPFGTANPWGLLSSVSLLLLLIFFVDATIIVWRRGDRRRASFVGGSMIFGAILAWHVPLVIWGIIEVPFFLSFTYSGIIAAMAYELSNDMAQAAHVARQLQASEADLRETKQRMELAASAADLGMWMWDIARNEIWITDKGRALFGFAASGKLDFDRFKSVLHPEDRESVLKTVENSLRTGAEYEAEYRVILPDGQMRWIAGRGHVEFNKNGQPARMRGASLDITQRKQAEEQFRLVVEAAPNAMIMVNAEARITLVNTQAEAVFGYTREELIGHPIEMLVPERFRSQHIGYRHDYFGDARARPVGAGREFFGQRKDGSEIPLEIGLNPIHTSEGLLVLTSIIDISERKQAELQAQQQRDELEQLRQQRTVLLEREVSERTRLEREVIDICAREQRRIAYDLHDSVGQQLVGIALCAKLFEEQLRSERHSEADKAGILVKLANDAARQTRLTARTLEGADGVGDLKTALQSLAISVDRDCSVKATVTAEGSSFPISPPVAAQLYRIAQEAVHNAVEHGAAREVHISLAFNHEVMVLTIRDNGKGFDSNANGNGMGLRIMRYRAQCIGGSCDVQSSSEGTVVRCRVPLEPQLAAFGLP
jgi:PAS domain S-box-containing protein